MIHDIYWSSASHRSSAAGFAWSASAPSRLKIRHPRKPSGTTPPTTAARQLRIAALRGACLNSCPGWCRFCRLAEPVIVPSWPAPALARPPRHLVAERAACANEDARLTGRPACALWRPVRGVAELPDASATSISHGATSSRRPQGTAQMRVAPGSRGKAICQQRRSSAFWACHVAG
jgi:hypothetical protein